jgi:hypothetical protein
MKTKSLTFLLVLTILLFSIATPVLASSENIVLVCNFQSAIGHDGKKSQSSGSTTFTITFLNDSDIIMKQGGLDALFTGKQSEETFYAKRTNFEIQGKKYHTTININRYSGKLTIHVGLGPLYPNGIVFYGECIIKANKLF